VVKVAGGIDTTDPQYYTVRMAMGRRERARQSALWVAVADLPTGASHPFYQRLNRVLASHGFDDFVERQCAPCYAKTMGRPGLAPGIYFRALLIGYFEGLDSERGIAWRAADSLALRDFLGVGLETAPPDHSTISRTRRLMPLETHRAVFTWVLQCLGGADLVRGTTLGVDATTLEANAALRTIVRRDTGEGYQEYLTRLAQASGIETPTRADLARVDRKRKKKGARPSACGRLSVSRIAARSDGGINTTPATRSMRIGGGFVGHEARPSSVDAANSWSGRMRICTRPAACAV